MANFYAHSIEGVSSDSWHSLGAHLEGVSNLTAAFADGFGCAEIGRLLGLWHDIGKYRHDFQRRLRGEDIRVDHAVVGALRSREVFGKEDLTLAMAMAFAIAGHHGGLANLIDLEQRLKKNTHALSNIRELLTDEPTPNTVALLPGWLLPGAATDRNDMDGLRRATAFWIRFLFSSLVDADFLDTEAFYEPIKRAAATTRQRPLRALRALLDTHLRRLSDSSQPTAINRVREEVLQACRETSKSATGVFSLSAPTGSGKTLSGMSFALQHAECHGLRKVIVVIPYTSIIEQNAGIYRTVFGGENVIEHHSNVDPARETKRNRLASENWDAPIIVTTNVQFFESLFANRPSRCRKLHNVARSVILLDEVQSLPPGLLLPIVEGLNELAAHYGCSIVLSTATQPALAERPTFTQGLKRVREILPDTRALAQRLDRVHVTWPSDPCAPVAWPDLGRDLCEHERVLAIVHRRKDAQELCDLLPEEGRFHLSALMCPMHRAAVLRAVQNALGGNGPCRVVSTQLIEAGVDIDFPVVYRALAGLDSIVQAAGRCNREGGCHDRGSLYVFRAPTQPPPGTATKGLETTLGMLDRYGGELDIHNPHLFDEYFRSLYFKEDLDARNVQRERQAFNFASVAEQFKLIEDNYTRPIVVPYAGVEDRLDRLRANGPSRGTLRALQPFLVTIPERERRRLEEAGALEVIDDMVTLLAAPFHHLYRDDYGLVLDREIQADPETLCL